MDKIRVRKEIAALIDELQQYTGMLAGKDIISQAEVTDLLKKATELHRNIVLLDYLTGIKAAVERGELNPLKALDLEDEKEPELIKRNTEQKVPVPSVEVKPEELKEEELKPHTLISASDPPVAEVLVPPPAEEIKPKEKEIVQKQPEPEVKPEIKEEPKNPQPDLFGDTLPPVTEVSKEKAKERPREKAKEKAVDDKSLASKLQKKSITDLKQAIGINEKFQFINELFGGNMNEYNIAVNQVNICRSREEAEVYLDTLRDLYKWDPDNDTVQAFSELVERRFL